MSKKGNPPPPRPVSDLEKAGWAFAAFVFLMAGQIALYSWLGGMW